MKLLILCLSVLLNNRALLTTITTASLLQLRWSTVCFSLIIWETSSWRNTGRVLSVGVCVITFSRRRWRQWTRRMCPLSCRPPTTISSPYTGGNSSSFLSSRLKSLRCLSLSSCTEWQTQSRCDSTEFDKAVQMWELFPVCLQYTLNELSSCSCLP